jgi:hypothetical protein
MRWLSLTASKKSDRGSGRRDPAGESEGESARAADDQRARVFVELIINS